MWQYLLNFLIPTEKRTHLKEKVKDILIKTWVLGP